jgi:hypothetical protein
VTEGSVDDLLKRGGAIEIQVSGAEIVQARVTIRRLPGVEQVTVENGRLVVVAPLDIGADLNRALVKAGIFASAITPKKNTLEGLFLELTEGKPV